MSDKRKKYQVSCRDFMYVLFQSPICKITNAPKVSMPDTSTSAEFGPESHVKCIGVYNPKDVFLLNGGINTLAKAVNEGTELELNDQKYQLRYILFFFIRNFISLIT